MIYRKSFGAGLVAGNKELDNFPVFALEAFDPPGSINKFLFASKERMAA